MIRGAPTGDRFKHCSFENFEVTEENREAYEVCKRVAEDGGVGVILRGRHGLGKTHLLVALMKAFDRKNSHVAIGPDPGVTGTAKVPSASEMIRLAAEIDADSENVPALAPEEVDAPCHIEYWPLLDLTSELRSDISRGSQNVSRRCRECDLLVLDDFGSERVTDFVLEELERIVDWRYRTMKITAIATNLTFRELSEKYGQRAISRWTGSCEGVDIGGTDRRPTMDLS